MLIRPQRLILAEHLRAQIFTHARKMPLLECCGLLIGSGEEVVVVEAIEQACNIAAQPSRRFEIDPQTQFNLLRRLRGGPQRIIGHYHSHPGGPAAPSDFDLSMAYDAEAIWVIASLSPAPSMAAFVCPDQTQGFLPLALTAKA